MNIDRQQKGQLLDDFWKEWKENELVVGEGYKLNRPKVRSMLGEDNVVICGRKLRFRNKDILTKFLFDISL